MSDYKWNNPTKKIEDLIRELNASIFDEKIWKSQHVWKIAEVTYSYDKDTNINETLFWKIWGLNLREYKTLSEDKQKKLLLYSSEKFSDIIHEKLALMKDALYQLNSSEYSELWQEELLEKEIFESAVIEKMNLLEYCLLSLPFELEKAGVPLDLDEEEISELEKVLLQIDSNLFWGQVKDNPEEVELSYDYFKHILLDKKNNLTKEEQCKLECFLQKVKPHLPKNYQFKKRKKTQKISGKYLSYEINRTDYILAFNMLVDAFGKMHHVVKSDKAAGSISDGPEGVYFPMNEKFNTITIERFFKLWMHEIETHSVTDYNTKWLLWNLRGAKSTEKDEGVAILMEQLFLYGKELLTTDKDWHLLIDKTKVQINGYFIKTLMWELLNSEELMEFLEISEKIDPDIIPPIERFKRLKRNNRAGVQHKDTTYTRGLLKAISHVNLYNSSEWKKWISPSDMFIWKISFQETEKLKKLKQLKKERGVEIEDLLPIFVSDAVYFVIEHTLWWTESDISELNFIEYLKNKYPLFPFSEKIDASIYFGKNSRVHGIANILLKIISNRKVDNILMDANPQQRMVLEKIFQNQYDPIIHAVHENLASHRQKQN